MKKLILMLSLCFVLFACFEKEKEVTVVPIKESNIMECQTVKDFIENTLQNSPHEPRTRIDKFLYNNKYVFGLDEGGEEYPDQLYMVVNTECKTICFIGGGVGFNCPDFKDAVYVETVWQDER